MNTSNTTILDNGNESVDRYTVIYHATNERGQIQYQGMSDNPNHPQGFCQWGHIPSTMSDYSHIGKEIAFNALPRPCQAVIESTLSDLAPSPKELIKIMREDFDSGDQWGWVMSWLFALADYAMDESNKIVDGFKPSPMGPDSSSDQYQTLKAFNVSGDCAALTFDILSRYERILKAADLSY
jgi:hypothetical protein